MLRVKGVTLIAATNRPDMMNPAALRAGRFGRGIVVPPPDTAQLMQMFHRKRTVLKVPFAAGSDHVGALFRRHTFGPKCPLSNAFTGADIDALVKILAEDHLVRGVEGMKPQPITQAVFAKGYHMLLQDREVRRAVMEHKLHEVMNAGATCSINSPAKDDYYKNKH